jgi:hypothetical protein
MVEVLNEGDGGCEFAHLSPTFGLGPYRRRIVIAEPTRGLTAWFFGDPLPGMSALDRRGSIERAH